MHAAYQGCSDLVCLLAHPVRLHILTLLARKPATVSEIVAATGRRQPNVSQQLAILRTGGLIVGERIGRQIVYRVTSADLQGLLDSIQHLAAHDSGRHEQAAGTDISVAQAWFHEALRAHIAWRPVVDISLCDGCGICVLGCMQGVYAFDHEQRKPTLVAPDACNVGCSTCATLCPPGAIALPARETALSAITGGVLARVAAMVRERAGERQVGVGSEAA